MAHQKPTNGSTFKGFAKFTSSIAGISSAAMLGAQSVATAAIPYVMSSTGTVISGVGTVFPAGGVVASLQSFSMLGFLSPPIIVPVAVTTCVGAGVYIYKHKNSSESDVEMATNEQLNVSVHKEASDDNI